MGIESCRFKHLSPERIEEDSSGRSEESHWELPRNLWKKFLRSFGMIIDPNPDTYLEEREIPIRKDELPADLQVSTETQEITQKSEG